MVKPFFLLLFLPLAGCLEAPQRSLPLPVADPAPRGLVRLRDAVLGAHDIARAAVGIGPIAWSDRLAGDAAIYADELARTHRFAHATQASGASEGENLWMGTRAAYTYAEMIGAWAAERQNFVDAPVPANSRTGRFEDVGHYSQMIWPRSTEVGCSLASDESDDYLVCRYAPAGNVYGQRAH